MDSRTSASEFAALQVDFESVLSVRHELRAGSCFQVFKILISSGTPESLQFSRCEIDSTSRANDGWYSSAATAKRTGVALLFDEDLGIFRFGNSRRHIELLRLLFSLAHQKLIF